MTGARLARLAPGLAVLMDYRRADFRYDLAAGLSVAAVAVPVGIAYAALAGFDPVVGLYASILPLVAYALFGSSRQVIIGPDSATCAMVAVALAPLVGDAPDQRAALSIVLTAMVGLLYLAASRLRLGALADFLSRPILTGFLSGVALTIIAGQLGKVTGVPLRAVQVVPRLIELVRKIDLVHWPTLALALAVYGVLELSPRLLPRIPAALLGSLLAGAAVGVLGLDHQGVAMVGAVPGGLPALHAPLFPLDKLGPLLGAAAAVALVGFTSSIVTVRAFAAKNHYDIDVDRELVGLGAAQLAAALSQSFPVAGADSRTASSDSAGGRTQVTGLVAAAAMAVVLVFLTGPMRYLPVAALGSVLIKSAISLIDVRALRTILRVDRRGFLLALVTMVGVLWFGPIQGVLVAVVIALLHFIQVAARPDIELLGVQTGVHGFHDLRLYPDARTPPGLVLFRFNGPLTFFNADYFRERLLSAADSAGPGLRAVIVDATGFSMREDTTAILMLFGLSKELASRGVTLALAGRLHLIARWLSAHRVSDLVEHPQLFSTLEDAIDAYSPRESVVPETGLGHGVAFRPGEAAPGFG
jgi:high affinity sulfate transporter 1